MRSLAAAIDSVVIVVSPDVVARAATDRASLDIFDPVWISVPAIVARPPTSAVDGRSVNPARRTVGLLLILADSTRAFRPTVFTVAFKLSRAVFVCVAPAARDTLPPLRVVDVPRDVAESSPRFNTREPTRTTSESDADAFVVVAVRLTTLRESVALRVVALSDVLLFVVADCTVF